MYIYDNSLRAEMQLLHLDIFYDKADNKQIRTQNVIDDNFIV